MLTQIQRVPHNTNSSSSFVTTRNPNLPILLRYLISLMIRFQCSFLIGLIQNTIYTIMCFLVATYFIPLFVHSSVKIISINAGLSFIQSIFLLAIYHDYYTSQRQKNLIKEERFDRDNFRNKNWKVLLFSLFQGFISFILFVANACFLEDTMMFSFLWINIMRIVGLISAFYVHKHNGIYFLTCFYQPIYFLASVLCFVFQNSYTFSNYELAEANSALELLYIGIAVIIDIMVCLD